MLEDGLRAVGRTFPGPIDVDGHAAGDRLVQLETRVLQPVDEEPVDEQFAAVGDVDDLVFVHIRSPVFSFSTALPVLVDLTLFPT